MNPYVGACGRPSYPFPMQVGQGLPGQFAGQSNASYWQNVIGGLGGYGPGIPAGTPGDPCPGSRPATPEEIAAGMVDAGGRCYLPPGFVPPPVPYNPPPPYYGGPCGPAVFPAGYVQAQALAGLAAQSAPQQPIGLSCGPVAPQIVVTTPPSTTLGGTCDACCTAQGCFCVTDIVVGDCGPCVWLISSIKSGLCELIQCGDILGDTFYCNCDHPPLKSSMLMPGIEFCISVQNILSVTIATPTPDAEEAAAIAAATRTFYATVWGLPGDNSCAPCIGPDPYQPPYNPQFPRPVYTPPGQIPRPVYTPPGFFLPPGIFAPQPAQGPL